MHVRALPCVMLVACALIACGGATPPPKDSDEAVASSAKPADSAPPAEGADKTAASAAPSASAVPDPVPAPAGTSATDSSSASSTGGADDPWMASHQMTPKDVLKGTRAAQAKAQACFRAGVKRDPSTSGEVKIRFVITNDGVVRVWRDEGSSMTDAAVTECVGDLIKKLKFPKQKSPGDAYGVYTVNFSH
jgi:hypothetical protein